MLLGVRGEAVDVRQLGREKTVVIEALLAAGLKVGRISAPPPAENAPLSSNEGPNIQM